MLYQFVYLVRGECLFLPIVLFLNLKLNTTFLMSRQNKTKLQRGVYVWMIKRAGNNKYFFFPFAKFKTHKNLSIPIVGAYIRHIHCSAFYKHYFFLPFAVLITKTNDMTQR